MKGCKLNPFAMLFSTFIVLMPFAASANDGMVPFIHELIQKEQDVTISLKIADSGEPGLEESYRLKRVDSENEEIVLDDHVFDTDEAVLAGETTCRWWEPLSIMCDYPDYEGMCNDCDGNGSNECFGQCVENPDTQVTECVVDYCDRVGCSSDCDNDGINDCDGWCRTIYTFDIVDKCVPPGNWGYELYYYYEQEYDDGYWKDISGGYGETEIEVVDSNEPCEEDTEQEGDDTEEEWEDTEQEGDVKCSITAPGELNNLSWLGLLLDFL